MLDKLKNLIHGEEGQGMAEYGLVLGVLAIGIVAVFPNLRNAVENLFVEMTDKIGQVVSNV